MPETAAHGDRPPFDALDPRDRVLGTLIGGALGDAFGRPLEDQDLDHIQGTYGRNGMKELGAAGRPAHFSDDTQLTLYTADALTELLEWTRQGVSADPAATLWLAYLRWLRTQGEDIPEGAPQPLARDIDRLPALQARRGPGKACLEGLRSGEMGTRSRPLQPQAKGSGALMRSAPFGLVPFLDEAMIVSLSSDGAALTHGHPSAWQASAGFSLLIHWLAVRRMPLRESAQALENYFEEQRSGGQRTEPRLRAGLHRALELAQHPRLEPTALTSTFGDGWLAEEALPLAVYAVLVSTAAGPALQQPEAHFRAAIRIAANHSGDSDTVAAVAGNILGAHYGRRCLPEDWVSTLDPAELSAVVSVSDTFAEALSAPGGA